MEFCVSWQFFRKFSSHSTRQDLKYLFCLLHKSTLDLRSFFSFIWEPQCIGCYVCYLMVMTQLSPLLFSVFAETGGKKLRSTVQRSTETGLAVEMRNWMTRQASRESTDGSMNSYSSEGKWVMLAEQWSPPRLAAVFLLSLSLLSQTLTRMLRGTALTFTGWFAVKKTSAYLPLRNVTCLAFYINGHRFGDKVFHFKGKILKYSCHKWKFALPWNDT